MAPIAENNDLELDEIVAKIDENQDFDLVAPVARLKTGLPVKELLQMHQTEFEVKPDENDDTNQGTSAESCFNFDELAKFTNLDLIDFGQEDGDDSTPFDRYRKKMTKISADGKLLKYVVKQGTGCLVPDNCIVYIRYQAYFEYQEVPFDSTFWQNLDGKDLPVEINLAKSQVLPGLQQGILSMRKGEKAEFLVHPDLAYGHLGCPPRIPPDATILFIVELGRFVDCGAAQVNNDDDLSIEERSQYCNVIKKAKANHNLGNDLFSKGNFSAALNRYRQVINMMHNARLASEEEEKERNHFLLKNYVNASLCYHKLKMYKRVCIMAADAARVNPSEAFRSFKLLYFWGYAKMMLSDYDAAKKKLLAAKKLKPLDRDIAMALKDLEKKKHDALQQEKLMMKKAFGFPSSEVKIREIDEEEERFRNRITEVLEAFKEDPNQDTLTLRDNYTYDEENILLHLAKEMGLYARVADGIRRVLHIRKPNEL